MLMTIVFSQRICLYAGAWIPKVSSASEYLQIDLLEIRNISSILTQGRDASGCGCSEWVSEYTLSYSLCGGFWKEYKTDGIIKVDSSDYFIKYVFFRRRRVFVVIIIFLSITITSLLHIKKRICPWFLFTRLLISHRHEQLPMIK